MPGAVITAGGRSRRGVCWLWLLLWFLLKAGGAGAAQSEDAVKAAYIYNVTKFITWPAEAATGVEPVVVCILGRDGVGDRLDDLANRVAQGRPLQVRRLNQETAALPVCQILFIGRSEQSQLPRILHQTQGSNTLLISDIPQFATLGGTIGFATVDDRVKVEINIKALQQAGLKVQAKLLEVARIIQ